MATTIFTLEDALQHVKEGIRSKYRKVWMEFVDKVEATPGDFNERPPTEEELMAHFKYLRKDKKMASSSMWTYYSIINSVYKGMYKTKRKSAAQQ